jgi:chemotaxis protein MotA
MDLATIIGLVAGVVTIIVVLILDGGSPAELVSSPAAILLIIGGSLAATTISFPIKEIANLPKLFVRATRGTKFEIEGTIDLLSKMADKARREGLLALEDESKKIQEPFLKTGIMLVVDGVDPTQVRGILESNIHHMEERHAANYGMFSAAGGFAPTFGIIGTVMGLIGVLKALDDPNKLAGSIASAFLATLWGLIFANLLYLPIAAKLRSKSEEESKYRRMLMEGIISLQSGENPRILKEKLLTYLSPKERANIEKAEAKAPAGGAPQKARAQS